MFPYGRKQDRRNVQCSLNMPYCEKMKYNLNVPYELYTGNCLGIISSFKF